METIDVEITMPIEAFDKLEMLKELYQLTKGNTAIDAVIQSIEPGIKPVNPRYNAILNGLVIDAILNRQLVPMPSTMDEVELPDSQDNNGNIIDITGFMK